MHRSRTLAALFTLICLFAQSSFADTYYIRTSGSDSNSGKSASDAFASLEHVDGLLQPGDIVYIGAGTYNERVRFTVSGTQNQPIQIIGDTNGSRTGDAGTVTLTYSQSSEIVRLTNADYYQFYDLNFLSGQEGIRADSSEGILIQRCTFSGSREKSIGVINNAQIRVENSVISGNKRGIHVVNGHAVVRDSVLENLGTEALEIQNSGSSIDAQRCVIRDVRRALYMHNGTGTLINTLIHNVSQQGVYTRNNSTLVMIQCTLDQVTKEGARFRGNTTLYNNIFTNMGSHCTRLDGGRVTASHNLMFKRRGDRSNRYNAPEFEFDPLYVDAANGNYTLQSGSPARDIGFDISSYTQEDFAQNARPSGAGWDLGAYEGGAPTILYVRTRGSDNNSGLSPQKSLRTIQKAISLTSEAGSKIYVGPGVYRESLQIGSGSGSGAGSGSESQPIELIADTAGRYTLDSPGEVQIDGRNSSITGITMTERTHWVIENLSFINQRENGIYATNSGLSINNCRFDVGTGYAIYATATGDITIDGCTFDRNDRSGNNIWVTPNNQSSPTSIRITRNDMAMRGDLYHSTGYQNGGSAIRGRSSSNRYVYGIIVYGWSRSQIESVEISNNLISDCYLPIYFNVPRSSNYETSIANNTVTGSCYSLYVDSRRASKSVLINNIIDTCYYGVFGDRSRSRNFTVAGLVEHNITFNMERYRRSFESRVITESPKFFDAPAGDFSLIAGSPCIDAGMLIGAPSVDILGQSRPTDGDNDGIARIDIGALEQVAESTRVKVVQWREVGVDSER